MLESNPRKFILHNNKGSIDLLSQNIFGANPEGLGVELSTSYYSSYGNYYPSDINVNQAEIDFEVIFGAVKNPYQTFMTFVEFVNEKDLYLEMILDGIGSFKRAVMVKSLPKSQLGLDGVLRSKVTFSTMTPWFKYIDLLETSKGLLTYRGKVYDYTYRMPNWFYGESSELINSFRISCNSVMFGIYKNSPLSIIIRATEKTQTIYNPSWLVVDEDGRTIFKQTFDITIYPGEYIKVESDWFSPVAKKYDGSTGEEVKDIINLLTVDSDGYTRAPIGDSTFYFSPLTWESIKNDPTCFDLYLKEESLVI